MTLSPAELPARASGVCSVKASRPEERLRSFAVPVASLCSSAHVSEARALPGGGAPRASSHLGFRKDVVQPLVEEVLGGGSGAGRAWHPRPGWEDSQSPREGGSLVAKCGGLLCARSVGTSSPHTAGSRGILSLPRPSPLMVVPLAHRPPVASSRLMWTVPLSATLCPSKRGPDSEG